MMNEIKAGQLMTNRKITGVNVDTKPRPLGNNSVRKFKSKILYTFDLIKSILFI